MAETENAVSCMNNVNPSALCVKHIVGEEDTDSRETTRGHDHYKCIEKRLSALNMEDSDKDFVGEEDTDPGEMTHVHDHDKCIKEKQVPLYMEDSDEEMTSENEMGMTCYSRTDFDHMDYMDFLQALQKYLPPQPKPMTWEEWDALLTKKEMEGYDMANMEDLWYPKYDSECTLVWSDTDEE